MMTLLEIIQSEQSRTRRQLGLLLDGCSCHVCSHDPTVPICTHARFLCRLGGFSRRRWTCVHIFFSFPGEREKWLLLLYYISPLEAAPTGVKENRFFTWQRCSVVVVVVSRHLFANKKSWLFVNIYKLLTNHRKVRESPFFFILRDIPIFFFCVYWGKFVFLSPMFSPVRSRHLTAPEKRLPFHLPST